MDASDSFESERYPVRRQLLNPGMTGPRRSPQLAHNRNTVGYMHHAGYILPAPRYDHRSPFMNSFGTHTGHEADFLDGDEPHPHEFPLDPYHRDISGEELVGRDIESSDGNQRLVAGILRIGGDKSVHDALLVLDSAQGHPVDDWRQFYLKNSHVINALLDGSVSRVRGSEGLVSVSTSDKILSVRGSSKDATSTRGFPGQGRDERMAVSRSTHTTGGGTMQDGVEDEDDEDQAQGSGFRRQITDLELDALADWVYEHGARNWEGFRELHKGKISTRSARAWDRMYQRWYEREIRSRIEKKRVARSV
ncbi:unnamed protein product [Peniophora sp. CBMAI 1063]|nr:unnamed protein product [Peniophora sp. CBMAI 1063]